jgi:hypothetical protein
MENSKMEVKQKIAAFVRLGEVLRSATTISEIDPRLKADVEKVKSVIIGASYENPWFIEAHVSFALNAIGNALTEENLTNWLQPYLARMLDEKLRNVAVIMAGNIPAVGFHDFMCILLSGNKVIGRLSARDKLILPALAEILSNFEPGFKDRISFTEERLTDFDAVIATGSDNSSRYFEYYFGKYPNIIRKNRNAVALLDGNETALDLKNLGKDIFMHFGLGCRNVSKLYIPAGSDPEQLRDAFDDYAYVADNHKYHNNYDYYKSIYMINRDPYFDNGFLLLKEGPRISSPVSVVFFEYYKEIDIVLQEIEANADQIQCVVSGIKNPENKTVAFGKAQEPDIWDYADGVDTLNFLLLLN